MKKNIWFTADTHFNHANIIKYCNRPFETITDMDATMVENWNAVVKPGDTVYHIGDFMMPKQQQSVDMFLNKLNGKKILIKGNHDSHFVQHRPGWKEVHQYYELKDKGIQIVMFHYPIASWNGSFHRSWHLHGHTHGTYEPPLWDDGKPKLSLDVGVDTHNFTPWSLEEVKEHMNNLI